MGAGTGHPAGLRRGATALAQVCSTPLGVWLLRTAYLAPGTNPALLLDATRYPTPQSLQAHLWDQLTPRSLTPGPRAAAAPAWSGHAGFTTLARSAAGSAG